MRGKLLNLITFILILLGAVLVLANIGSVSLDSPANGAVDADGAVTFQCTASPDAANVTDTIQFLANFSTGLQVNSSQHLDNGTNTSVFTIGGISDGRYTWMCASNSTANGTLVNSTSINNITIDSTRPTKVGPLTFSGKLQGGPSTDTKFDFNSEVTIKGCGGNDALGGNASLRILIPDTSGERFLRNLTGANITATDFVFRNTGALGDYVANCTYVDNAGNFNSTFKTFKIQPVAANRNTAPRVGTYRVPVSAGSTRDLKELTTEQPLTVRMSETGTAIFNVNGEEHSAQVMKISKSSITLTLRSEPKTIEVSVGESQDVDLNADGTNDVQVTLVEITASGRADVDFKRVSTPASAPASEPSSAPDSAPRTAPITIEEAGNLLIILIIVFVILLIIYFLIKIKKGGSSGGLKFSNKDLGSSRENYSYPYYKK